LSIDHGSLSLAVSDNGTGYPRDMNGGGLGLNGLRERAAQLGGELQLTAGPNGGARVLFRLPLHPADTQAPGKTL
jgi:signal transduction histidine kinase